MKNEFSESGPPDLLAGIKPEQSGLNSSPCCGTAGSGWAGRAGGDTVGVASSDPLLSDPGVLSVLNESCRPQGLEFTVVLQTGLRY